MLQPSIIIGMRWRDTLTLNLLLLILLVTLTVSHPVYGGAAKFDKVEYPSKVYDEEKAELKFRVVNPSISIPGGIAPRFFLRIYLDGVLIKDEMPESWECPKGQSVERIIVTPPLKGPRTYKILGKLFWLNQSIATVEDETSFEIKAVKLEVKSFKQSISEVTLGQSEGIPFQIQFSNGGNDIMYDVTLSVAGSAGIQISPTQVIIGDIPFGESKTVDLKLLVGPNLSRGTLEIAYKVSYKDFRGVVHTKDFEAEVTILKASTNIQLNLGKDEIVYNMDLTVEASLSTLDGKPISNQPIEFYINDESVGIHITDDGGVASRNLNMTIDVGVHEVKALFHGSSIYAKSSTVKTLKVLPSATDLHLSVPYNLRVGEEATAYVRLVDEVDSPIRDAEILLYCRENLISKSITNSTGEAEIPFTVTSKGDVDIKAVYSGDLNHREVEKTGQLKATALQAHITIQAPSQVWKGDRVTYLIRLTDELGKPIPEALVEVEVFSKDALAAKFSVKTDGDGIAEGSFNSNFGGGLKISARYTGDEQYASVESSSTLTVLEASILALVVIPMAGALAAIIAAIYMRRGAFSNLQRTLSRGARRLSPINTKRCTSCGGTVPVEAAYCDLCGAQQQVTPPSRETPTSTAITTSPPESVSPEDVHHELDERVFSYIDQHGGEISIAKAVGELGTSREDLLAAIDRLRKSGRLEQV